MLRTLARKTLLRTPRLYSSARRADLAIRYWRKRVHDPDFWFFRNLPNRDGLFVDIGANIGQSALSFRVVHRRFRVDSFEANVTLGSDLAFAKRLLGGGFTYTLCGLGDCHKTVCMYVPLSAGTPNTQAATMDRTVLELRRPVIEQRIGPFEIRSFRVSVRPFDDFALRPDAVKIDVEGGELSVLKGMAMTLEAEPILMIENGPTVGPVITYLVAKGFDIFTYEVEGNLLIKGSPSSSQNFFAITSGRMEDLRRASSVQVGRA